MTTKYHVIINSGSGSSGKSSALESIRTSFGEHGVKAEFHQVGPTDQIDKVIKDSIGESEPSDKVVIAAGGDGTVNAVAQYCLAHDATMGIIPLGTFNYFARNFDIPLTIPEAVETLLENNRVKATVGKVGKHYFLNNASLGLYEKIIENREGDKSVFGRFRVVAVLSAVYTLLSYRKSLRVKLRANQAAVARKTLLIFVANNSFQLENLGMKAAKCMEEKLLGVSIARSMSFFQVIGLLLKGAAKMLDNEVNIEQFCTDNLVIELRKRNCKIVIDGEIVTCPTPVEINVCPDALSLITPKRKISE